MWEPLVSMHTLWCTTMHSQHMDIHSIQHNVYLCGFYCLWPVLLLVYVRMLCNALDRWIWQVGFDIAESHEIDFWEFGSELSKEIEAVKSIFYTWSEEKGWQRDRKVILTEFVHKDKSWDHKSRGFGWKRFSVLHCWRRNNQNVFPFLCNLIIAINA